MTTDAPVVIIGAGIGGLTAALALQQRGFTVEVYERNDTLREVGAGLHLTPNGTKVLFSLGLGSRLEELTGRTPGQRHMRLWNTGQSWPLPGHGSDALERFGSPYMLMHRGDLHALLAEAVTAHDPSAIRLSSQCLAVETDADRATAVMADGRRVTGQVVVCADGIG